MTEALDVAAHLMLAFDGETPPRWVGRRIGEDPPAGFTLFRFANVRSPEQVRRLTEGLQAARPAGTPPLLVAADQEGGQFLALGDGTTEFAGNMALGATGDADLAEQVGRAVGRELRALGVNVNYAPDLDLATEPRNVALGIRSFGDDPAASSALGAAFVRGLQSQGVAATAKHFPGKGGVSADTHHGLATVAGGRDRFDRVELAPFRAALDAGARLVMSGHFAAPGLTGNELLPATLSHKVMTGLLRDDLGFGGVTITDALDMKALAQGAGQVVDVIAALRAGVDLLLCSRDRTAQARVERGLVQAASRELFEVSALAASAERVGSLRRWIADFEQPALDVVGGREHRELARRLAEAAVTLVRDDAGLVPLRLAADETVLVIQPIPSDLTPADTSSAVRPMMADAIRSRHPRVREVVVPLRPTGADIAAVLGATSEARLVIAGTYAASFHREQAMLVDAVLGTGVPTVTVALRTPWDLPTYPRTTTHVATYGILRPQLDALADALFGRVPFCGRLPVALTL